MKETVRWESVIETDPETNEQYWSRKQVTVQKAEEHDRLNAVLDILKGTTTAEEVWKKYDITSINSVYTWIGKYVSQEKSLSLEEPTEGEMAKKSKDGQIQGKYSVNRALSFPEKR